MKSFVSCSTAVVILAISLSGCGSKGSAVYKPTKPKDVPIIRVATGEERQLFPLAEGNEWNYVGNTSVTAAQGSGSRRSEIQFKITKVTQTGSTTRAEMDIYTDGAKSDHQIWDVTDQGIFQISAGLDKQTNYSPPQPTITWPLTPGRTFDWQGNGLTAEAKVSETKIHSTLQEPREVDTLAGPIFAYGVEGQITPTGKEKSAGVTLAYWAPKVGLVRFTQQINTTASVAKISLSLKSYTLK